MQRIAFLLGLKPGNEDEYRARHDQIWPEMSALLTEAGMRNYTIFLREPENLLFGYWEYHGEDFDADMKAIAADPETQRWWTFCEPCQVPLASRAKGAHWATMEPVFHMD